MRATSICMLAQNEYDDNNSDCDSDCDSDNDDNLSISSEATSITMMSTSTDASRCPNNRSNNKKNHHNKCRYNNNKKKNKKNTNKAAAASTIFTDGNSCFKSIPSSTSPTIIAQVIRKNVDKNKVLDNNDHDIHNKQKFCIDDDDNDNKKTIINTVSMASSSTSLSPSSNMVSILQSKKVQVMRPTPQRRSWVTGKLLTQDRQAVLTGRVGNDIEIYLPMNTSHHYNFNNGRKEAAENNNHHQKHTQLQLYNNHNHLLHQGKRKEYNFNNNRYDYDHNIILDGNKQLQILDILYNFVCYVPKPPKREHFNIKDRYNNSYKYNQNDHKKSSSSTASSSSSSSSLVVPVPSISIQQAQYEGKGKNSTPSMLYDDELI